MEQDSNRRISLAAHRRALDRAFEALRGQAARWITQKVLAVSRRVPGQTVEFLSSMGTWTMVINERFVDEDSQEMRPIDRLLWSLKSDYGWGAVPIGEVVARDGVVISAGNRHGWSDDDFRQR